MNALRVLLLVLVLLANRVPSAHAAVTQDKSASAGQKPSAEIPEFTGEASRPMNATWSDASPEFEMRLSGGGFVPLSKVTILGQDYLTGPGYSLGAQLLLRQSPHFYFGLEFERLTGGKNSSPTLKDIFADNADFDSAEIMAIERISTSEGKVRPYAIGGVGLEAATIRINGSPQAGHVWPDTGTTETRNLVNSFQRAPAFTFQIGFDYLKNANHSELPLPITILSPQPMEHPLGGVPRVVEIGVASR